ncbi:MAG: hypothetical protein EZS28_021001 [Streblomastix strix]|uniref:Uncharacterized protein n=1 Tax=Streblomastix strix TaxID=222440 RepID=A0A5J4VLT1_9EUKA|nr:MAG: hypothetical protein EZS28_021001 [Streblomastix strix]
MIAIAMSINEVPITISNSISFIIKKMPRLSIKIKEFTITFNDDRCDQIGKIMGPIDADRLMCKNIIDSNCIEQDILSKDNINDAIEYLKSNEVPQIEGLYQALFERETFRHCSVYVSDKNNSKIISAANVGIQHENIDPNELQQLVDFIYEYDQSNKVMVLISFGEIMKKRQIKSGDAAIYRVEIKKIDLNKFHEIINDNQRTKQQYYALDLDDNTNLDRNWGTDIIPFIRDINDSVQDDTIVFLNDRQKYVYDKIQALPKGIDSIGLMIANNAVIGDESQNQTVMCTP